MNASTGSTSCDQVRRPGWRADQVVGDDPQYGERWDEGGADADGEQDRNQRTQQPELDKREASPPVHVGGDNVMHLGQRRRHRQLGTRLLAHRQYRRLLRERGQLVN
jgi:hypothetical protein